MTQLTDTFRAWSWVTASESVKPVTFGTETPEMATLTPIEDPLSTSVPAPSTDITVPSSYPVFAT
jgi:hypothetical protein